MSIRSLKKIKRRLIPVIAIAAAIVPTTAQAQVMLDGGGSGSGSTGVVVRPDDRGARGLVFTRIAQPVSGLDQTRVIPGYNAPAQGLSGLDQTRIIPGYNAPAAEPVSVSSPSGGFDWRILGAALLAFAATLAVMSWTVAVRRHRHPSPAV